MNQARNGGAVGRRNRVGDSDNANNNDGKPLPDGSKNDR